MSKDLACNIRRGRKGGKNEGREGRKGRKERRGQGYGRKEARKEGKKEGREGRSFFATQNIAEHKKLAQRSLSEIISNKFIVIDPP